LIYPSRATLVPEAPEAPPEQAPEPEQDDSQDEAESAQHTDLSELPQELLIEAVKALLPPDFLGRLASAGAQRSAAGTGAGQSRKSKARGRPAPSRPGRLDGQSRVDVIATLRSAAPWQKLRAARKPQQSRITIFPNDIHLKRYEQRAERLVIFIVDASGSAAMARLAEAKGAVELLLAEAYARRDYVALIAFRGASGDLMLPPTRSLVQTKRRLSALPGGGGTPLAGGLQAAGVLAQKALSQGKTPVLALLTDGRANISLDGSANRQKAAEDAALMAGWISGLGIKSVVMDVARSPNAALADLAQTLRAEYYPMPRADAHGLSQTVHRVLDN
jgi:magnesium chelatase subunit D